MEEQVYTYQDLIALTELSISTIKRRLKRLERSADIILGRKENTESGHLVLFSESEVETFLDALITQGDIPPEKMDQFAQMKQERVSSLVVAPTSMSGPVQRGSVGVHSLVGGMDELAVSRTLSELAEHQLPIRASSAGILIALFENRSRPYSPETIREWCKGRGHAFDRVGFRFTWADGAILVSRPLI